MSEFIEMEMPTPCQKCGNIFDLNDGVGSGKWFPNTIICETCGIKEDKIVELESELEAVKLDLENAKWDVTHYGKRVDEINQALQKLESAV